LGKKTGLFISLEGPDGAGKTTQARLLKAALRRRGREVLLTREPGGSPQAKKIRNLLLSNRGHLSPRAELLLFMADRAQHCSEILLPALSRGVIVLCDRYLDSTLAYQGFGRGFSIAEIRRLQDFAAQALMPRLTLLFDLEAPLGLGRAKDRGQADRMEAAGQAFHRRVRQGFLRLAKAEPKRIKVIRVAGKSPKLILQEGLAHLEPLL
jgi:dTMP kinase